MKGLVKNSKYQTASWRELTRICPSTDKDIASFNSDIAVILKNGSIELESSMEKCEVYFKENVEYFCKETK